MAPGLPQAVTGGKPTISPAVKRRRAELIANLQWLCRLFLETREQLFAAHDGTSTEKAVCDGLREELDAIRFRQLLEEGYCTPAGQGPPPRLMDFLYAFGRRVLHGRRLSAYGRRAHDQFLSVCAGHADGLKFVNGAVPRVLQLFDRLIDDERRGSEEGMYSDAGSGDPWAAPGREDAGGAGGSSSHPMGWDALDSILEAEGAGMARLQEEADAFLSNAAMPTPLQPLQLPGDGARQPDAAPGSGSNAPRGRRPARPEPAAAAHAAPPQPAAAAGGSQAPRRLAAQSPYYSGDPVMLSKVARTSLSNLDGLVAAMVPGAEITSEGLLLQLADDELVMFAYVLEQITDAASKQLIKKLEERDELRSTCMHRREYLQLLDGAIGQPA